MGQKQAGRFWKPRFLSNSHARLRIWSNIFPVDSLDSWSLGGIITGPLPVMQWSPPTSETFACLPFSDLGNQTEREVQCCRCDRREVDRCLYVKRLPIGCWWFINILYYVFVFTETPDKREKNTYIAINKSWHKDLLQLVFTTVFLYEVKYKNYRAGLVLIAY